MYSDLYTSTVYFHSDEPIQNCELSLKKQPGALFLQIGQSHANICMYKYKYMWLVHVYMIYNLDMFWKRLSTFKSGSEQPITLANII